MKFVVQLLVGETLDECTDDLLSGGVLADGLLLFSHGTSVFMSGTEKQGESEGEDLAG